MATAVARPPHRRQGSDVTAGPLPALGPATATVTLDGRLLEIHECQQRGRMQKEDEGRGPTKAQAKGAVARPPLLGRAADKPPMTPPRVSGVSLAPLPNLDNHSVGEKQPFPVPPKLQRRPSMTHCVLGGKAPPPPAGVAGCGGAAPSGGCHSGNQHFIAEGRSIQRAVSLDPWVAAYLDIHGGDCDSVCATPRRLNMQDLARADINDAFGPLSPCPLSPSILTLCGQPGHDDQFALNGTEDLMDMRTCQSPKLPPV